MSDTVFKRKIIQGEVLFQEGRFQEALQVFEEVIRQKPESVEALNNAGVTYLELGRIEEAIEALRKSLEINPGNQNSFFSLIDCYWEHGEEAEAGKIYKTYEKYVPESTVKQQYKDALAPYVSTAQTRITPETTVHPDVTRGEVLFQNGQLEDAEQVFKQLLNEDPAQTEALNNLGVIAVQKNQFPEAVEYFVEGLESAPRHPDLTENMNAMADREEVRPLIEEKIHEYLAGDARSLQHRGALSTLSGLLDRQTDFRAAQKTLDITPPVSEKESVLLQGYAGPPREAQSMLTPLTLQMLLLEDTEYNKSLIISADLFGFGARMVEKIREAASVWGIPPEAIILNASHTHYAPGTVENIPGILGPYYEMYAKAIVQAVAGTLESLYQALEPCFVYSGSTNAQIGVNRRARQDGQVVFGENPDGYYEKHTPFLMVDFVKSSRSLVLINHGCHPTGYGAHNQVSADYPAYVREAVKEFPGVDEVMFLQGAAGSSKSSVGNNGTTRFTRRPEEVVQNGMTLASVIKTAMPEPLRPVTGTIFATTKTIDLPLQKIPTAKNFRAMVKSAGKNALVKQWAEYFLQSGPKQIPSALSLEIQLVSLGEDTLFLTLPGEPVAELGRQLLDAFPKKSTPFLLGYTNGLKAYLPTAEQVREGGYESDTSRLVYMLPGTFEENIEERLVRSVRDLLTVQRKSDKPNGYGRYHLRKDTGPAFFTLSSGRCGTKTLAHILNIATNARVYHHPMPYLVDETLQAYHDIRDKRQTFWRARRSVIQDAWKDDLIFGELDHNMTPFATTIAEDIPEAKFIVLVRNPWDFVRSGMRRNYYNGHPWDSGRLRPEPHHPDFERWHTMSRFQKVCWLWNETYQRILHYLEDLPENRYTVIRFEDLIDNPETAEQLFHFLGLDGYDAGAVQSVLSRPLNKQTQGAFPKPGEWTPDYHQMLWNECEKTVQEYGYSDFARRYPNPGIAADRDPISGKGNTGKTQNISLLFLEQDGLSTGGHLDHVVPALQQKYHVNYLKTTDLETARQAIRSADVVWLEWASQLTAAVTQHVPELRHKPVICRLHGFEVFTQLPAQIQWDVVDKLVFVANHKRDLFHQRFPKADVSEMVIRNGVNIDKFAIPEKKQNTKNLLLLGHINYRKGLTLLLQFYHELLRKDPEFDLYIRGDWQDLRYKMAVMTMVQELGLENKVTFVEEWIDDLNAWLADKSHILSFSLEESFHYAIGNGMAAGMKPVIHAWNESRDIWPEEFIFNDLEGFLRIVSDGKYQPERYRQLLQQNQLDQAYQLERIKKLLTTIAMPYSGPQERKPGRNKTSNGVGGSDNGNFWQAKRHDKIAQLQQELDKYLPISGDRLVEQSKNITTETQLRTIKCERLGDAKDLWEVELEVLFSKKKGLIVQFLMFDSGTDHLYVPPSVTIDKSVQNHWISLIKECLAKPNIRLNDNLFGNVFDNELLHDIKNNFQEYVWERMYPGTVFTPYKKFIRHMVRYNFVKQYIRPEDIIIDAACGIGYGTRYLAPHCRQVNGVDISNGSLSFGSAHYHYPNISWLKADVMELPVGSETISHYVSMETFEHVQPVEKFLHEINRVLQPGGYAFISTPNGGAASRKHINNPYHEHEYHFNELTKILGGIFQEVHIKGLSGDRQIIDVHEGNAHSVFSFLCMCRKG